MYIVGIVLWVIVIWLAASFSWGVRQNTSTGFGVTIQTTNTAMLFTAQAIVVGAFDLNPLHFLWMIPVSFIFGSLSLIAPFSLLSPVGNLYGRLCCLGLDAEVVAQNKARLRYVRELVSTGHSLDEATHMALEKYPGHNA
ncbi:hypothetical protein [Ferrigenium sp. UT5]|uniref:hypothetical protein n=1 Tax=Ferrigenium sp. UT5 TaxID=3242105 RepID=UPI0035526C2E